MFIPVSDVSVFAFFTTYAIRDIEGTSEVEFAKIFIVEDNVILQSFVMVEGDGSKLTKTLCNNVCDHHPGHWQ